MTDSGNNSSEGVSSVVDIGWLIIRARLEYSNRVVAADGNQFAAIGSVCAESGTRRVYLGSILLAFVGLFLLTRRTYTLSDWCHIASFVLYN